MEARFLFIPKISGVMFKLLCKCSRKAKVRTRLRTRRTQRQIWLQEAQERDVFPRWYWCCVKFRNFLPRAPVLIKVWFSPRLKCQESRNRNRISFPVWIVVLWSLFPVLLSRFFPSVRKYTNQSGGQMRNYTPFPLPHKERPSLGKPLFSRFDDKVKNAFSFSFQLKALSHYANEQIEVAVSFASKPEIVTNIRQRNVEVSSILGPFLKWTEITRVEECFMGFLFGFSSAFCFLHVSCTFSTFGSWRVLCWKLQIKSEEFASHYNGTEMVPMPQVHVMLNVYDTRCSIRVFNVIFHPYCKHSLQEEWWEQI